MGLTLFLFAVAILVFEGRNLERMMNDGDIDFNVILRMHVNFWFCVVLSILSATWGTHDYYITTG